MLVEGNNRTVMVLMVAVVNPMAGNKRVMKIETASVGGGVGKKLNCADTGGDQC